MDILMEAKDMRNEISKHHDSLEGARECKDELIVMQNPNTGMQIRQKNWIYYIQERRKEVAPPAN